MSRPTGLLIVLVCVLFGTLLSVRGCQRYGKVSDAAFAHAKALYSVCNRRDSSRLESCSQLIISAETSGELSSAEAGYLRAIIAAAQADDWATAQADARRMMAEQSGR
ncbi:MAG: hypothetical protein R3C59_08255 [Planctomycetaceae bacterium]